MRETENKYKCIPFWSWNDELDEEELVRQIDWMKENGVGGFFMHARGGLKTEYLGKKWFDCVDACGRKAQAEGMEAYAYDENGWPSGFVGGKLLEDMENRDRYLTFATGEYDKNALVSYLFSENKLQRITGEKNVHVLKEGESYLNVYEHYSASTADILNGEVVDKFIALTHEEYHKRDTYSLKGFFTDEPQYYRWGTSYTKAVKEYFEKEYGEDILNGLGLLFVEADGYRAFRYKYWKAMQTLFLKNFSEKVYRWCDERGYKLTGHYVEESSLGYQMVCNGGIMPFYEFEHIPGIDWLGRGIGGELAAKQVGSVAAQLGKKQVITESFACCGWDVTPKELKKIAECQYVDGVNLMCQHLMPYAEHGQRKRDYPAHYSKINAWVRKNFKEFNDYFSVLGKLLSQSEEIVSVGVLHPIRSAYFNYKRAKDAEDFGVMELDEAFAQLTENLGIRQIPHHYLDETLLAKYGRVEGKKLVMGKCAYEYLILPKMYTMDKTTEKLLREYVENGGKILLSAEKPEYLEGEKFAYDYLKSNVTLEEISAAMPYALSVRNANIRTTLRKDGQGRLFLYAVNLWGGDTTAEFSLKDATAFKEYDILSDTYRVISTSVDFAEGESRVLYFSDEKPTEKPVLTPLMLGEEFEVCEEAENYLTLDYIRYSFDGKTYSEPLHHMGIFNEMLKKRYKGKLYLKYAFTADVLPEKCQLLAEDTNTEKVWINGEEVQKKGSYEYENGLYIYDVAGKVKLGENEIVILIDYYQSEQVYYALFGENVTESLKNCLAYDTDIEAVYLRGNFGVYGDFKAGQATNVLLGENFRLGEQKKKATCLIEDGYPFFAGDIRLKQKITVEDTARYLKIDERFQLLEVKVNGKYAGTMMFDNRLDLSGFLKQGENEIELILTVSNRNLFGPFHTLGEEDFGVGPYTFERAGTWKDGKSSIFRESYSFVKTIV